MDLLKIIRRPAISKEQAIDVAKNDFIVQGWKNPLASRYSLHFKAHFQIIKRIWYITADVPQLRDGIFIRAEVNADTGEIIDAVIYYRPHGGSFHRDSNKKLS